MNDLQRLCAMSTHWDEMADAAVRRDNAGFDAAMMKFRNLEGRRATAEQAARNNHGG